MGDKKEQPEKELSEEEQMRRHHKMLLKMQMVEMVLDLNLLGEEQSRPDGKKGKQEHR